MEEGKGEKQFQGKMLMIHYNDVILEVKLREGSAWIFSEHLSSNIDKVKALCLFLCFCFCFFNKKYLKAERLMILWLA